MAFVAIKDKDNATLGYLQTDAQERLGVHNLLHVQDRKAAGTQGGGFTSGAWRTRDLNTIVVNNISGASLAANQITLPAGTYYSDGYGIAYYVNVHRARLADISNAQTLILGSTEYTFGGTATYVNTKSNISGKFVLSGQTILELQHACSASRTLEGFGMAINILGENEIFADLKIWKVA